MRIGIDATCWTNTRGYGRFTRHLVTAMTEIPGGDEFVLFIDRESAGEIPRSLSHTEIVEVPTRFSPSQAASSRGSRSPIDLYRMSRAVNRSRVDAFFFPTVYSWFPLPRGLPSVVTIHDAIAEKFPEIVVPGFRAWTLWRLKCRMAIFQATRILTVSEYARRDVSRFHSIPMDLLTVAVEAPSDAYNPSTPEESGAAAELLGVDPERGWFVYVGGMSPHKNVPLLVRAFARLSAELSDPPFLILVGPGDDDVFHGDRARVKDEIRRMGVAGLVKWAGYLPDELLRRLMSGATALVLPSECEGFGLPAVEAAACGTAVIATTESPLPELLEGAGIFVDPQNEQALYEALALMLSDTEMRTRMGNRGITRAAGMSWTRAAHVTLDTIHSAA